MQVRTLRLGRLYMSQLRGGRRTKFVWFCEKCRRKFFVSCNGEVVSFAGTLPPSFVTNSANALEGKTMNEPWGSEYAHKKLGNLGQAVRRLLMLRTDLLVAALPRCANTSCGECWMDFEDESALFQHIETEHPFACVVPPYQDANRVDRGQVSIGSTKGRA